jgi:hypothetical protein
MQRRAQHTARTTPSRMQPTPPCRTAYFPCDAKEKFPALPAAGQRHSGSVLVPGRAATLTRAWAAPSSHSQQPPASRWGSVPFCIARISACRHTWWVRFRTKIRGRVQSRRWWLERFDAGCVDTRVLCPVGKELETEIITAWQLIRIPRKGRSEMCLPLNPHLADCMRHLQCPSVPPTALMNSL